MKSGLSLVLVAAALASTGLGCGGTKPPPPQEPSGEATAPEKSDDAKTEKSGDKGEGSGTDGDESKSKSSICSGFDIDLIAALGHSACEVPDVKATDAKSMDMKGKLEVKLAATASRVDPGGQVDFIVQMTNKTKAPLSLDFLLDPTPRFQVEAYDSKGVKRVDMPAGKQPTIPAALADRPAAAQTLARVTLAPNGTAHAKVSWNAVRTRWAPEKLKGTPPEMGYPRVPAGPLGKGRYMVRVVTPLLSAMEGSDKEVSAPRAGIEVAK